MTDYMFIESRPCFGKKVLCLNKANDLDVVAEKVCNARGCKYYE